MAGGWVRLKGSGENYFYASQVRIINLVLNFNCIASDTR